MRSASKLLACVTRSGTGAPLSPSERAAGTVEAATGAAAVVVAVAGVAVATPDAGDDVAGGEVAWVSVASPPPQAASSGVPPPIVNAIAIARRRFDRAAR
ncbi:MAG TPA: hypothetical protein QGI71_04695 [Dehalococcoidia bacterium]|nr:hypothetical protein [Dehalococcoidia bacterium]